MLQDSDRKSSALPNRNAPIRLWRPRLSLPVSIVKPVKCCVYRFVQQETAVFIQCILFHSTCLPISQHRMSQLWLFYYSAYSTSSNQSQPLKASQFNFHSFYIMMLDDDDEKWVFSMWSLSAAHLTNLQYWLKLPTSNQPIDTGKNWAVSTTLRLKISHQSRF